jgi:toxin ParE1/3/4
VTPKPVLPRQRAEQDIQGAVDQYLTDGGPDLALRFIDALERTLNSTGRHPAAGSPRYSHDLGLPGLRFQLIGRFSHLIFYLERDEYIDVWRVLHGSRDIAAWMQSPE